MIGIDRYSGQIIKGNEQLSSRIREIFSTITGTESKRRGIGTDLLQRLGDDLSDSAVVQTQHHLLERLNDPANGLFDVRIEQVQIETVDGAVIITVNGLFIDTSERFELTL